MRPEDILFPTPAGVYCKIGGFHIDPTRPVDKAVITHGHSDHARAGHGAVLATQETLVSREAVTPSKTGIAEVPNPPHIVSQC